jgi:hypothetical protein
MNQFSNKSYHAIRALLGILALYVSLCGAAHAACAPSSNGATIPSNASLCDNANNTWTVVSGVVQINGANAGFTNQVIVLLWQNGTIYQENASHLWWKWSNNAWVSTPAPESLSNASIPPSPQLNDSQGNYWTVSGGIIYLNGNQQVGTQNVVLLLYYNRVMYQKNSAGGWWLWNGSWVATTDPRATTIVAQHSGKCLDVTGGGTATALASGTQLDQWTCVTGAGNQLFLLQDMGGSQYEIISSNSNKCISPVNGGTTNGTRIEQLDCAGLAKQLWSVASTGTAGKYQIVSATSGRCLDVAGGPTATADGTPIDLWDCVAGATNQTWTLTVPPASGPVQVIAKHSGKCLDVVGGGTATALANGTKLDQWTCVPGADNQVFTFKYVGSGQYYVISKNSGKCMEVVSASTANGAAIDQLDCNGTAQQLWKLNTVTGGYKQIISALSGKCLDVSGGPTSTGDGVLMDQWDCVADAPNQMWTFNGLTPAPACTQSSVAPAIGTKAAWDSHFFTPYTTAPALNPDGGDMAWNLYYWVRAYVSMALTYGDTKYLDRAVTSIDYMITHENSNGTWGAAPNYDQLGTAQVSQAIMQFVYTVYKDPRFVAYRSKADIYLAHAERAVQHYDYQWVDNSPILGASFWRYATCGTDGASLCGTSSLLMYNQGASMAKAMLLMDRVYRMKGQTPPSEYLYKASKSADYFLRFAQDVSGSYQWRYSGGRTDGPIEDTNHAHVDLTFLVAANNFKIGGLTDTNMGKIASTLKNRVIQPNDFVAPNIDGTGTPADNWQRVSVGYDWIDFTDYDPAILGKVVSVFNHYMSSGFDTMRGALGWAEIQRKNSCVSLY